MQPEKFIVINNSKNIIVIKDLNNLKIPSRKAVDLLKYPKVTYDKIINSKDLSSLLSLQQNTEWSAITNTRRPGARADIFRRREGVTNREVNLRNPNLLDLLIVFPKDASVEDVEQAYQEAPKTNQGEAISNLSKEQRIRQIVKKIEEIKEKLSSIATDEERQPLEDLLKQFEEEENELGSHNFLEL